MIDLKVEEEQPKRKSVSSIAEKYGEKQMDNYRNQILQGDCLEVLKTLPDGFVDCCVTSPPYYGLRDYGTGTWVGGDENCPHRRLTKQSANTITGHAQDELKGNVGDAIYKTVCPLCGAVRIDKQIGLEETPEEYINKLVSVFHEVKRVLKDDGTLWVNIGDSYAGSGKGRMADGTASVDPNCKQATSLGTINGLLKKSGDGDAKPKDLIGIPWMLAFALRNDGWYLRQDIIWHKPNPMPEPVKDRCVKSHEYIFLLSKKSHYYFDYEAIQEEATGYDGRKDTLNKGSQKYSSNDYMPNQTNETPAGRSHERWQYKNLQDKGQMTHTMHERSTEGLPDEVYPVRNKRDVWSVPTKACKEAHFATFPENLITPCILAGCPKGGIVLDVFFGSGTTGRVASSNGRDYIGIELNPEYIEIAKNRTTNNQMTIFSMM